MRRVEIAVLFMLGVVGGAVGSAWYFHRAPVVTDKAAVQAIVAETLARTQTPGIDRAAVETIVADALARRPAPGLDAAGVKSVVSEMLAADDARKRQDPAPAAASLDPSRLDPLIENYLMRDPGILQRMSDALDRQTKASQAVRDRQAIAANTEAIFTDPDNVVLGNPHGDVTLVELFDYNCGFCRGALPDIATLLAEDKNLRIELKQFPILSSGSVDAARVALQVARSGKDYWTFHQALYTTRGEVDAAAALAEAKTLGLDPEALKAGMQAPAVTAALQKSYDLARALNVTGTPTYIIGDQIIPGAVPLDSLKASIANMRTCGSAVACPKSG